MDLRHRHLTAPRLDDVKMFIRQRKLGYQPFEFTDTLQVDHWTIDKLLDTVERLRDRLGSLRRVKRLFRLRFPASNSAD